MSFLTGCSKDITADSNAEQLNPCNDFEIPVDDALKTLSEFLETEELTTKSSALSNGEFTVEKWPGSNASKAIASSNLSVYCISFSKDQGSAILAADSRLPEKIYSVTDTKITAADLDVACERLRTLPTIPIDTNKVNIDSLQKSEIHEMGELLTLQLVTKKIIKDINILN